jgi:hypothetical protein
MTKEFYTQIDGRGSWTLVSGRSADKNRGVRFVVPTLSTMKQWKGWGTQLCEIVKILKNLGCATRRFVDSRQWSECG